MDPAKQTSGPLRYKLGPASARVIESASRAGFSDYVEAYTLDTSLVARTAIETRPQNVTGCFVIKAFGVLLNPGSADAAQLASDYAALNAAFQTLEGQFQTLRGQAFGVSHTMQSMIGSRAFGVTYTNSTGRPIAVYATGVTASVAGGNLFLSIPGFVQRLWGYVVAALVAVAAVALVSPLSDRAALPEAFIKELVEGAQAWQERRYGEKTLKYAKLWGTEDLCSVEVAVRILGDKVPGSPEEIYLLRATRLKRVPGNVIKNNPQACAVIIDNHHFNQVAYISWESKTVLQGSRMRANGLRYGGINFLLSNKPTVNNIYEDSDRVSVRCTLADVFRSGGRIYPDVGGICVNSVIVELPQDVSMPVVRVDQQS